jgi:hypothetical protein
MKQFCRQWMLTAVLSAALVLSLTGIAGAQQCEWIVDYTETFAGDQQSDESVPLYGRGVAEGSGTECGDLYIEVKLKDPNGVTLDFETQTGGWYVEEVALEFITYDNLVEGEYTTGIQTWDSGVHVGCADSALQALGAARFAYRLNYTQTAWTAWYIRCHAGSACRNMLVLKSAIQPSTQTWPLYIYMKLIWFGSSNDCFGSDINSSPVCVADI